MHLTCFVIGDDTLTHQCTRTLLDSGHEVCGLISGNPELRDWARDHGVPFVDPAHMAAALRECPHDYLFSIANLRLIPIELVRLARRGAVNFHDGPLPHYAGVHATSWALINGERTHGITWHFIEEVIDAGAILKRRIFDIGEKETAFSLNAKCFEAGIETFRELIGELADGVARPRQQDLSRRSYFGMWKRPEAAGVISWRWPAKKIDALVRGLDFGPYPNPLGCAKVAVGDDFLICTEVDVVGASSSRRAPGSITAIDANSIRIAAGEGELEIRRFWTLSGQPMTPGELAERYALSPGKALPELESHQRKAITSFNEEVCRDESFWALHLSQVEEIHDSPPDADPAEYALYVARVTGKSCLDLLMDSDRPAEKLFLPRIPFRVDVALNSPASIEREKIRQSIEAAKTRKTYVADLPFRLWRQGWAKKWGLTPSFPTPLFQTFVEALRSNPQRSVTDTPLISDEQRRQVLIDWNQTSARFPEDKCLPDLFEEQAIRAPDSAAVVFEDESITYDELNRRGNQLARFLRKNGAAPDVLIGISIDRSIEMVVAILAVHKAGAAYVPLDPDYPADRRAFILEDARIDVVITQELLSRNRVAIASEDASNLPAIAKPQNLAYVIYTSGSTGKPKGVMVEHRNVVNFFTGMDARIAHEPGQVWLAVTSLSFDISVLELLWTLCRGFKVVLYSSSSAGAPVSSRSIDFSLFYFSAGQSQSTSDKYRLLIEGAKFADEHGFTAVWTPERHFHEFGGLYPNPSVTSAALATITKRVQLRSGSVVAPLHSPIRIAEEWSVVDNLSNGRVALSFASGWMPNDFVIRPEDFADRKNAAFRSMEIVRRLWRGEEVEFTGALGKPVQIKTLPRPIQEDLPVWVTTAGNPETYELAARAGANVLTHLLGQSVREVADKIALYRKTWQEAGHPGRGYVTLMLHTFVGENADQVKEVVREPLIEYLRTSADLLKKYSWAFPAFKNAGKAANDVDFSRLPEDELGAVLEFAFTRYFETSGLFGTPDSCMAMVETLKAHDIDEIACLIDFGIPAHLTLESLKHLDALKSGSMGRDYNIGELIRRHGVTHMQCTPSMMRMMLADDSARMALRLLQVVMIGGEAFPDDLAEELKAMTTGKIVNMYGPTETTIWSGTHDVAVGRDRLTSIPIGRPIANTQFYIVSRTGEPQPIGMPGELWIGGDGVARGYWNRTQLTAERFIPNPFITAGGGRVYRTGDLAQWLPDGTVQFLGRIDDQVKIRGHRIELGEIEAALRSHEAVHEAAVVTRQYGPGDVRLIAYAVALEGHTMDEVELRQFLQTRLPEYMTPARIIQLDALPLTPNKKIDRRALPDPEMHAPASRRMSEAPCGSLETRLAAIWAEVLGLREIGRKDDFFAIGGDSLSLVQVSLKAEQVFGKKVPIGAFVQARTLEKVAKLLEGTVDQAASESRMPLEAATVRAMREADMDEVIRIHSDHFPDWRVTMLGPAFLKKMYRWFMKTHGDLALVALKDDRVVGFTVGSTGDYKKDLMWYALPQLLLGAVAHPGALIRQSRQPNEHASPPPSAEVANNRIMAVAKSANGGGVDLMLAFEAAAERKGLKPYFHDFGSP